MDISLLEKWLQTGVIAPIDRYFGEFVAALDGKDDPLLPISAALLSRLTAQGHVCMNLKAVLDRPDGQFENSWPPDLQPGVDEWIERLLRSSVVGRPGQYRPLVLDTRARLYLYRYWRYEKTLADAIMTRSDQAIEYNANALENGIHRLFPQACTGSATDWQKVAAAVAILKPFCVIAGGPGTGKTHTVAKILALLVEQSEAFDLRIRLAAPTGKAAARLGESIRQVKAKLDCRSEVLRRIPEEAETVHRLLGARADGFVHHDANRLKADVVVVDEASMIDVSLMSNLIQALPDASRLILIGDKDQLASVEAGSVLGDITNRMHTSAFSMAFQKQLETITAQPIESDSRGCPLEAPIRDSIVHLATSFRFTKNSGIGGLSKAVNHGDPDAAFELLCRDPDPSVQWSSVDSAEMLAALMKASILNGYRAGLECADPREALAALQRYRIVCAVRNGPFGTGAINRLAEKILRQNGLIGMPSGADNQWYHGRPIMITRNDYQLGLFNGDAGMVQMTSTHSEGSAALEQVPELVLADSRHSLRRIAASRINHCETAFAMTVHKSQGSEFDSIHLVLPDMDSPVLTRELLYTAITRARRKVRIWGTETILRSAIRRRIRRSSGLREALWGQGYN